MDADERDARAEQMINDLRECLCASLAVAGRAVCCCQWRRADQTYMPDACSCPCPEGEGVAWIRIAERQFGDEADIQVPRARSFSGGSCGPGGIGEVWEMEAGVSRCWPEDENGLECDAHSDAAADGAWDEHLMVQALLCCEPLQQYSIRLRRVRTLGPQGGCIAAVAEFFARPAPVQGTHPSDVGAARVVRGFGR